jgi:hypothetical protein
MWTAAATLLALIFSVMVVRRLTGFFWSIAKEVAGTLFAILLICAFVAPDILQSSKAAIVHESGLVEVFWILRNLTAKTPAFHEVATHAKSVSEFAADAVKNILSRFMYIERRH